MIDTRIEIVSNEREYVFTLPYTTHLEKEDVLDDGEIPYTGRIAIRTSDSKLPGVRETIARIAALIKEEHTMVSRLRIASLDTMVKMRNVCVFLTKSYGETGIEFEAYIADVGWR